MRFTIPNRIDPYQVTQSSDVDAGDRNGLIPLALLSLAVGAVTGLLCAVFRLALEAADWLRNQLIAWAHQQGIAGLLIVLAATAGATALAAWLVRRFSPDAAGSGIPQVEVALSGDEPARPLRRASVKFIGGLLAIGAGLALGREGPSVQMGASIGDVLARTFHRDWAQTKVLFAAGAGVNASTVESGLPLDEISPPIA